MSHRYSNPWPEVDAQRKRKQEEKMAMLRMMRPFAEFHEGRLSRLHKELRRNWLVLRHGRGAISARHQAQLAHMRSWPNVLMFGAILLVWLGYLIYTALQL